MIERALARQPDPPLNVCTSIIVTLIGLEAFGTLQRLCEDMMTAARRRSALQEMIGIASFSAWALVRMGELADAEAQARWALERATGIYAIDSLAHLVETWSSVTRWTTPRPSWRGWSRRWHRTRSWR